MNRIHFIFFIVLLCSFFSGYSAEKQIIKPINLEWKDINILKPYCMDCVYEDNTPDIPRYTTTIKLPYNPTKISVSLQNKITTSGDQFKLKTNPDFGNNFDISYETGVVKNEPVVIVTIKPIITEFGKTKLLKSADIIIELGQEKQTSAIKKHKNNSVLQAGTWRKIKVKNSGIYKITYDQLTSWGFQNPENIRVYGTGGKMLSTRNDSNDPDGLYENPIYMETNGDGVFNSGDYILYYGQGNVHWSYNNISKTYIHEKNIYSDEGFYFISTSLGAGKRISEKNYNSLPHDYSTESVDISLFLDDDISNPLASGRLKFGELLPPMETRTFAFNFPIAPIETENLIIQTQVVGNQSSSEPSCSFEFKSGGTYINRTFLNGYAAATYGLWDVGVQTTRKIITENPVNITAQFLATSIAARGAIDYIRLTARVNPSLNTINSLFFSDYKNINAETVKRYSLKGNNVHVWNVTDPLNPKKVTLESSNNENNWKYPNNNIEYFMAFNKDGALPVEDVGIIENQNLHGTSVPEMVIVTAPLFTQEAERLAKFRRTFNNLNVLVIEPQTIYNEFSSGIPDPAAIRNFMRMFYLRSEESSRELKYLLLIGDGTYDNKWAATKNNYILTYQHINSTDEVNSYESDDFYGLLDADEGGQDIYGSAVFNGFLDIAIGRLPVETIFEAQTVINKIIEYSENPKLDSWKNELTFMGDDADNIGDYQLQAQAYALSQIVANKYPWFNNNLILLDSYQQISTPAGQRYPEARDAINSIIHRGTLLFNYTGHGGPNHLAHEAVVDKIMVNNWKNKEYLPFFMTASCEVARYDDHRKKSLGELILLNPEGGAVSLFTTTRAVYMSTNHTLSIIFYNRIFERNEDGNYSTIGEIMVDSKNKMGSTSENHRKFTLLGDPSMKLIIPPYRITTDSLNGISTKASLDTIGAMQKVTICGAITDTLGNQIPDYNGIIYPTVYDKAKERQTLGNDGNGTFSYYTQDNILYKGKASINGGRFSFEFIVPLDIEYDFGIGKISYYAQNGKVDAQGAFQDLIIGGSSNTMITDAIGPEISLFLNDTNFVSGGATNESPILIAHLYDEQGINTTGNGIGHEITARLKHDYNNILNLNSNYESDLNSYQRGSVEYQLLELPDGPNQITMRAWDILNNSTEIKLDFMVANTEKAALSHVLNYPNPFTTNTKFLFEHNQPHVPLEITIQIFTVSGRLIKTLQTNMQGSSYFTNPLTWDGRDDFGDRIGRGVYIYAVKIKTPDGKTDTKFERLVILK
ncbi:MAG: type IX secretion system sortase PorU [Salinivirgaceae bacterium]|nr:type IX secretion system sortase PorU [Salinivirgaceae bacterium]